MSPLTQTAAPKQLDTNERVLLRDQPTNKEVDLSVALAARKGDAFLPPDAIVNTLHVPANVCKPEPGAATKSSGAGSYPQAQTTERSSVPRTNGDAPVLLPPLRDKSGDKSGVEKQVAHAARAETALDTALNLDESLAQRKIKTSLSGANGSVKPNNERLSTEKKHQIATSYAVPTASSSTTTFHPSNSKPSPDRKVQVGRATTMAWGPKPLHYRRRVRVALGMLAVVAVVAAAVILVVILRSKSTPTDPPSAQPSSIPSTVPTVYPTAFPSAAPTGLYWTEVGTIGHLGGSDDVAISLSADGTHVAVGGGRPRIFGGGGGSSVVDTRLGGNSEDLGGFVRVYRYDDDGFKWDPVGQALHRRSMEKNDAWFGSSVSLSLRGNRVAVGGGEATSAPNNDEGRRGGTSPSEEASGMVSIFELEDDSWTTVGNISVGFNLTTASSSAATDVFLSSDGNSVACIVGGDSDLIEVHAWKRGEWTKVADFRGRAVALSWNGRRVAVGDPHANDGLGEVRVYDRVGGGNFVPNLTLSGKSDTKKFGFAVSLSRVGELLAVGATNGFNRETGHESGLVRVFENRQKLWRLYGEDIFGEPEEESFGRSVSLSSDGTRLAVGTQMSGTTHGSRIRVYEIEFNAWTQLGNLIDGLTTGPVASLSADGDRIVVRSKRDTGLEQNATRVQVLDLLGSPTSPPVSCVSDAACSCGPDQLLFDLTLVTDEDGDETEWLLTDPTRRFGPIASGGPYASGSKTYVTKKCVSRGCFQFTIYDSGSDGMCCVYGEGSYTVSLDGEMVAFGGRFGGEETTVFGSCPTPSPAPFPEDAFTPTDLETKTNATEQHGSATPSPGIVASHSATNPIPIPVAGLSFILMMQLVLQEHF